MKSRKKEELKRLLDILGPDDSPPPVSLFEARILSEDQGLATSYRHGYRKDNECMKTCYQSEPAAKDAARNRLKKGANVSKLRTYFCDICSAWHLTSSIRD